MNPSENSDVVGTNAAANVVANASLETKRKKTPRGNHAAATAFPFTDVASVNGFCGRVYADTANDADSSGMNGSGIINPNNLQRFDDDNLARIAAVTMHELAGRGSKSPRANELLSLMGEFATTAVAARIEAEQNATIAAANEILKARNAVAAH